MATFDRMLFVGVFVKDQKQVKEFFTKKIGLKVRAQDPTQGYLELGVGAKGPDASLTPWRPVAEMGIGYENAKARIGEVTGIGFRTNDLGKTAAAWKKRGVKVEFEDQGDEGPFARFQDPAGNTYFAVGPEKPKVRKAGIASLEFVTVVSSNVKRSGGFFTKALGMKGTTPRGSAFTTYRLRPKATGLMPFTPTPEMYQDAADAAADREHLGEDTQIVFTAKDIQVAQAALMSRGVRFKRKAERASWGGWEAEFYDPDDNIYWLTQMEPKKASASKKR